MEYLQRKCPRKKIGHMLYLALEKRSGSGEITLDEAQEALNGVFDSLGAKRRVIALPPDYTRLNSLAGPLTRMAYEYYGSALTDVMPALGTHTPMTAEQKADMFAGVPSSLFRDHNFRTDVADVGCVPAEVISQLSEGRVNEPLPLEVNKLLLEDDIDLILSIGQVVPHEVIGMANYTKNIFVGVGGAKCINLSHYIGATYGMERIMGKAHSPARDAFEYGRQHFISGLPIVYILTVLAKNFETGRMELKGLYAGDDFECFERAAVLSDEVNFVHLEEPLKTCVVYLDPTEFKSTWLGNKAVYRTRMALADGANLVILAPGLREFGEDPAIDALIRKYGYKGTPHTLEAVAENEDLRGNLSAAAHLIHGSSEGRFTITYCPGDGMSRAEIEGVGFEYMSFEEACRRYDFESLKDGMNPNGVYYISNPALGLWSAR